MKRTSKGLATRRGFLAGTAAAVAAPAILRGTRAYAQSKTLKIGFVSPKTGPLAGFAEADDYVLEVVETLKAAGVRAEADIRNEKINYKVREHSVGKVPVILAVGHREVDERTVSVRRLGEKQTQVQSLDAVTKELSQAATPPDLL